MREGRGWCPTPSPVRWGGLGLPRGQGRGAWNYPLAGRVFVHLFLMKRGAQSPGLCVHPETSSRLSRCLPSASAPYPPAREPRGDFSSGIFAGLYLKIASFSRSWRVFLLSARGVRGCPSVPVLLHRGCLRRRHSPRVPAEGTGWGHRGCWGDLGRVSGARQLEVLQHPSGAALAKLWEGNGKCWFKQVFLKPGCVFCFWWNNLLQGSGNQFPTALCPVSITCS